MFFFLFSSFLQFKGNLVCVQNGSEYLTAYKLPVIEPGICVISVHFVKSIVFRFFGNSFWIFPKRAPLGLASWCAHFPKFPEVWRMECTHANNNRMTWTYTSISRLNKVVFEVDSVALSCHLIILWTFPVARFHSIAILFLRDPISLTRAFLLPFWRSHDIPYVTAMSHVLNIQILRNWIF